MANEPYEPLTPREEEVLELLLKRWSNGEIADRLVLEERTVETHVAHILDKYRVRDRNDLWRLLGC